ncbi:MAG: flagellar basal-body rod protein FlgG [Gammaproteobacteria bacterium]|nr:flagellar basal-body rod protein FlgG [Gammaproteobacteria bacterium]
MLDAFYISATGMHVQETQVGVIANNLANVNTTGFKKSKADFQDLMYRELHAVRGLLVRPDIDKPLGLGAMVSSISKVFSQGEIRATEGMLDVAIQGAGFMEVLLDDGSYAYTRTGDLKLDRDGMLVNSNGDLLNPSIQIPVDAQGVSIQADGRVFALLAGGAEPIEIGRIELANFINPGGLTPLGDNLYLPSIDSGDVYYGEPTDEGFGALAQGFLEGSNVNLVEELSNLVLAQRGYEMNSKVLQAADEMLGIASNLRR